MVKKYTPAVVAVVQPHSESLVKKTKASKHPKIGGPSYKCDFCPMEFRKRSKMNRHKREIHLQNFKIYNCDECDKGFKRKEHYDRHMRGKHNKVKFQCSLCDRMYVEKNRVRIHLIKFHGLEACTKCNLLVEKNKQKQHKCCKVETKKRKNSKKKSMNNLGKLFECQKCCKRCFISDKQRKNHYELIDISSKEKKIIKWANFTILDL